MAKSDENDAVTRPDLAARRAARIALLASLAAQPTTDIGYWSSGELYLRRTTDAGRETEKAV